jgi:hypothetical protein
VLYELLTGHPDRASHELVFLADLTVELRAWPADTWSKVGIDPNAVARAVVAGWQRGDLLGLQLDGLTTEEALALQRPAMTLVRALAGQLDLDRDPLGQRVDVLAVQAGACGGLGVVGELDGAVRHVALAGLAAQLPLRQPAPTGGDAWLQGEAHDADGVDVGELGDDERPGAHVQADQPQGLGGGGDPQMHYRPLLGVPGVEINVHQTTLYNSIYRFDDEMLVNAHVWGVNAYNAPLLHLRRLGGGLFDAYAASFEAVWETSQPVPRESVA